MSIKYSVCAYPEIDRGGFRLLISKALQHGLARVDSTVHGGHVFLSEI